MVNPLRATELELADPITDLKDGLIDPSRKPVQQEPPGFFSSLRNPVELVLEESLPASLYQWITGNTKKVQAEKALRFLQQYPYLQNSSRYKEAERIYSKYGYLLEEGSQNFDVQEIANLAKQHPGVFGAELVNMIVADPYLFFIPSIAYARLGRGIVNSVKLKYSNAYKSIPKDVTNLLKKDFNKDIKYGAMASVLSPLAFSTGLQLGETGEISGSRTTAETTIGATAGLLISGAIGGISALTSRSTNVAQNKINQALQNVFEKNKSNYAELLEPDVETAHPKLIEELIADLKPELENLGSVEKLDAIKAQIVSAARPLIENGFDASKNTVLKKAASVGTIFAAAQFLTAEDEKIEAAGKGFILGSAIYGAGRLLNKAFQTPEALLSKKIETSFEDVINTADIMNAKYNSLATKITRSIKDLIPDPTSRSKVFAYITKKKVDKNLNFFESGKVLEKTDLSPNELIAADNIKKTFDMFYETLSSLDEPILFAKRSNYLPLLWEDYKGVDPIGYTEKFIQKVTGLNKNFKFSKPRILEDINAGLALGLKLRKGMDDPAELMRIYSFAAGKAVITRTILKYLKLNSIPGSKQGLFKVPYIATTNDEIKNISAFYVDQYVDFKHPFIASNNPIKVHSSIINSLKMIFSAETESQLMGAIFNTNLMMKRMAVGFSFFHAGGLVENMFFMGMPIKEVGKILNPRKAPDILKLIDNPSAYLSEYTHAVDAIKKLGFEDAVRFAQASKLEISIPEDTGFDRFYANMRGIDTFFKHHFGLKGFDNVEKVFKFFDKITWDRIYTSAKLYSFLRQLDKLVKPGDTQSAIYAKARISARVINDAFGGLNWFALSQEIQNPLFKKLAQTLFSPGSRGYMQLLMFAPDWTIANLRIAAKIFPLFESNPQARRIYQYYFARTALIYATIGTALNYIFSGHSILENKDPTRIDLGNGEVLTFSKQFMEPFDWVVDPKGTGIKKIGSLPKGVIEVLLNKKYLTGKWSPRITQEDDYAITKALKYGGQVGSKFLPIWVNQSIETIKEGLINNGISADLAADVSLNWFLGQTGHPKYKAPRSTKYKLQGLVRNPYETLF